MATSSRGVARLARGCLPHNRAMDFSGWPRDESDWDRMEVPEGIPDPRRARITVFLLGPVRVFRDGEPIVGGWRMKSLELLAYLGVHPHGASKDQILEALWAEGDPRLTKKYLWRTVSDLRCRLRGPSAMRVVLKTDEIYSLDFNDVWVDTLALESAARDGTQAASVARLRFSCDIYKGELCEGRYYGWATLIRERLRRLFIESARRLALQLEKAEDVEGAVRIIDLALDVDPYDEELCRLAMRLDARAGRVDRAARRWKHLRRVHLEDLGVEPSPQTMSAFRSVTESGGELQACSCQTHVHDRTRIATRGTDFGGSSSMAELEDFGIDLDTLKRMYREWQEGAPKGHLEQKYLKKTESHGKLFSSLVRKYLGKETEKRHPLVKENERLREMLRSHNVDPDTGKAR
jgi:DNA-binding SARP family transcriptional activator